ncbi:hypothetical protein D9M72_491420 [compost metagenome]
MGLVNGGLGAGIAFEVSKLNLGLVIGKHVGLLVARLGPQSSKRLLLAIHVRLGTIENAARFVGHRPFQRRALGAGIDETRMALTIGALHRGDLLLQHVILLAQVRHVDGFELRGARGSALSDGIVHLPVARIRLDEALLGVENLRVQFV